MLRAAQAAVIFLGLRWGDVMLIRLATSVAILCLANGLVHAASLNTSVSKEGKTIISLQGDIERGDAERLRAIVRATNEANRVVSGLRLNSAGGNLLESVEMAEIVKVAKISTVVANGATCASACFVVFSAGYEKFASYGAQIGVHGASDTSGRETVASGAATVSMARIVNQLGVPSGIVGKMVLTRPDQMVWLVPDDLRSMNVTLTGKPNQLAAPPVVNAPQQITPPDTQAKKSEPTWKEIVGAAVVRARRQRGPGANIVSRNCQPEYKICTNAIFFENNDGVDTMVQTVENLDGKIVRRQICEFNKHSDIRSCFNWDTGQKHRDMKGSDGKWTRVSND
jgi:hypothetical protein